MITLTEKQKTVLALVAQFKSVTEIAKTLSITEKAVSARIQRAYDVIGISNIVGFFRRAESLGFKIPEADQGKRTRTKSPKVVAVAPEAKIETWVVASYSVKKIQVESLVMKGQIMYQKEYKKGEMSFTLSNDSSIKFFGETAEKSYYTKLKQRKVSYPYDFMARPHNSMYFRPDFTEIGILEYYCD